MTFSPSTRTLSLILFFGLLVTYHANWAEMLEGDTFASLNAPYELLQTGKLSFDPMRHPLMFKWRTTKPLDPTDDFRIENWNVVVDGKTLDEWRQAGNISLNEPRYFLVESRIPGVYVNAFGPIPGVLLLPIASVVYAIDRNVGNKLALELAVGKLAGSLLVAGTATLLFLIAHRFVSKKRALVVALAYGLGSCAWATSSQTLWQQTVNQFLLTLGVFFYLGASERPKNAALTGLAFGAAAASRATAAAMLISVLIYLLGRSRRAALFLIAGSLPVPALIAWYNWHFFGSPMTFAQELVGHALAVEKTGSPDLWQTPALKGLAGLLLSPSRGLLIFSPLFVLSFWGMRNIWRRNELRDMRPLTIGTLIIMGIQCKWFDWWGGWTYGYRPWLEVVPLLALFMTPALEPVMSHRIARLFVAAAFVWSFFVQILGAFSYDRSWNERELFVVLVPETGRGKGFFREDDARKYATEHGTEYLGSTLCNIDVLYCRYRLWSWEDSIILFQLKHFSETRARLLGIGWRELELAP